MKPSDAGVFFQSMRLASGETGGAYMGIRGAGRSLYVC